MKLAQAPIAAGERADATKVRIESFLLLRGWPERDAWVSACECYRDATANTKHATGTARALLDYQNRKR